MRPTLAILCALLVSAPAAGRTRNAYLEAGLRLYADMEYETALDQFKKAAAFAGNTPADDVQIALYSGMICFDLGDAAGAESHFKTALALDPAVELPARVSPKVSQLFDKSREALSRARPTPPQPVVALVTPPLVAPVAPPADPGPSLPGVAILPKPADSMVDPPRADPRPALGPPRGDTVVVIPAGSGAEPVVAPLRSGRRGSTVLGAALLGVGAGLAGGGAFFGSQAKGSWEQASTARFQSDAVAYLDSARTEATAANVMFGVAATAAVVGVATLLFGGSDAPAN